MKTINSLISVIVLIVMLVSPQGNVSATGVIEAPQPSLSKLVWESKPDMPTARYNMGAAVSGGKIYVIGGDNGSCTTLNNVEEYDPTTNTWSDRAPMPTGRWALGVATGPDGKIYAIGGAGGSCGSKVLGTVEAYDPTTNSWEARASMPTPRIEFGLASAANGKIYAFGGADFNGWFATVEEYDPSTDTWTKKADMPYANKDFAITAANNGKIYIMDGGASGEDVWEYDPATDTWSLITHMQTRFRTKITQASNDQIYVIGGELGGVLGTVESYDIANNSWSTETSITTPRISHDVVALGDYIYVLGGSTGSAPLSSVEAGTITPPPPVLYAKQDGLTSGSCDNWANACDLQYALTGAVAGQEIWVAAGVYKPGTARTDTFQLKSGVALYGGFVGTETTRDPRNWQTNKTVLSGDIDNNDINTDGNFVAENIADIQGANAYHIVTGNYLSNTAILDGFIITAGQANDTYQDETQGGGIYTNYVNLTLKNIIFSANSAIFGGGMYGGDHADLTLTNVTFSGNSAGGGGGIYIDKVGGFFIDEVDGNDYYNLSLTNVAFSTNSAYNGAGLYIVGDNSKLTNVTFFDNFAAYDGGGILNSGQPGQPSSPSLINVTFSANSANRGGGIASVWSNPSLVNTILWGDSTSNGSEIYMYDSTLTVIHSDVQGGWPGTGNIDADPLFVDPAKGDLHLQAGSPAIDSGTDDGCPSTDLDGISRPKDGNGDGIATCDMGAYEFVSSILDIKIDIKPGSNTNPINLGANGVIPVAVLTTKEFNAASLDPATVLFAGAFPLRWSTQDVDYDGDMDLLFHFDVQKLQLTQSSAEASLTGKTYAGMAVKGTDKVKIVPVAYSYP